MTRTQDRRTILKWAMLGGGAALARLLAGPLAYAAAPTSKEQDAHAAFDRATRGMPSPHIKDVSVIQVGRFIGPPPRRHSRRELRQAPPGPARHAGPHPS